MAHILPQEVVTKLYRCGLRRNDGRNRFLTVQFVPFEARFSSYGEMHSYEAALVSCLGENTGWLCTSATFLKAVEIISQRRIEKPMKEYVVY